MHGTMTIIFPGSDVDIEQIALKEPPTLEKLQAAVGGHIEVVPHFKNFFGKPCVAYCNEEGKLNKLPLNPVATAYWATQITSLDDILCGPVVVLTGDPEILE